MRHEEMVRILSMVADGRLTAEQACSFIDAGEPEVARPKPVTLTSVIKSAVHNAVAGATEAVRSTTELVKQEQTVVPDGRRILIRASGSTVDVRAHDGPDMMVQTFGLPARMVESEHEISIDLLGTIAQLTLPDGAPVNLTVSGTRLNLYGLSIPVAIYGVGCDVRVEAPVDVHMDAHLDASNLEVQLPAEADPRVHIDCMVGTRRLSRHMEHG